jgi:hypothetical protein
VSDDRWTPGTVHVGMEIVLVVVVGAVLAIAMSLHGRRQPGAAKAVGHRDPERDSDLHRRRAEAEAEMEEHDVDDMIDAIAERRRRPGRRDIGEELADELLRGGWDKGG